MVVFMHLTYSFALLAQTEKVAPTQNQILPADFPKYVDTGNPQQDNQKYIATKQAWIAANPAVYEKIVAQQQATSKNKLEAEISPAPPTTQITEMIPPYNPTSTANLSKQIPNYNKEQQLSTTAEPYCPIRLPTLKIWACPSKAHAPPSGRQPPATSMAARTPCASTSPRAHGSA